MRFDKIEKPSSDLKREIEDAKQLFLKCQDYRGVADVLEVHPGRLKYWLYTHPGHLGYQETLHPKKSGGVRKILAPPAQIKILQNKLKVILDAIYVPKHCAHGFIAGRSVVSCASMHKKKSKWILNIDLKDFYPSIHFGRIRGLFISLGLGKPASSILAHLATCRGELPQGAPTSPVLSNMIARKLDGNLLRLAADYHLKYTRYADDITLSTKKLSFPEEVAAFDGSYYHPSKPILQKIVLDSINSCGFEVNENKTRIYSKGIRQEVTGLTVNEFVNVPRKFIRQIRAMIHAAEKHGFDRAGREYVEKYALPSRLPANLSSSDFEFDQYFKNVLYGKLAYLKMVRGPTDICYTSLYLKIAEIDSDPPKMIAEIRAMHKHYDVFICHASEDKVSVAMPLYSALTKINLLAFVDNKEIAWGDSITEKINHALSRAKVIIVILSDNSVEKKWPAKEINAALAREIDGRIRILPLIVGDSISRVKFMDLFPLLQDKLVRFWDENADLLANEIKGIL